MTQQDNLKRFVLIFSFLRHTYNTPIHYVQEYQCKPKMYGMVQFEGYCGIRWWCLVIDVFFGFAHKKGLVQGGVVSVTVMVQCRRRLCNMLMTRRLLWGVFLDKTSKSFSVHPRRCVISHWYGAVPRRLCKVVMTPSNTYMFSFG